MLCRSLPETIRDKTLQWGVADLSVGRAVRDNATAVREVVEQAAGAAVGGVHRAQEAPGLREQLAHGGGAKLHEVCAAMHAPEVG